MIAALDWVVAHRNDNGLNIKVIALAYGTDSVQSPSVDPLTFAVEQAWKAGITVVVAGGNDGRDTMLLANPAQSASILAVGAADTQGTLSVTDDTVPDWASRGTSSRHVDLVAPGVSVIGARVPNGYADERNPNARIGARFAKASGTSQATAVVAGEAALLIQANPSLTPDQVKQRLYMTAESFPSAQSHVPRRRDDQGQRRPPHEGQQGKDPLRRLEQQRQGVAGGRARQLARQRRRQRPARGGRHLRQGVGPRRPGPRPRRRSTAWTGGDWRGWTWSGNGWNASDLARSDLDRGNVVGPHLA